MILELLQTISKTRMKPSHHSLSSVDGHDTSTPSLKQLVLVSFIDYHVCPGK